MKHKTPWVVIGGSSNEIAHCTRCGDGLTMGGSQPIYLFTALCKEFTKHHSKCKDKGLQEPMPTRETWFNGRDTGTSSYTIYYVIGHRESPHGRYSTPYDPSDFGRCHRLLELFPEWRTRLRLMEERFPEWGPLVNSWDELTALYLEEQPKGEAPKLYQLLQKLNSKECLLAYTISKRLSPALGNHPSSS